MTSLLFRPIQLNILGWAVGIMAVLAIVFGIIIVLVSKYMAVKGGDPRIDQVRPLLAGANCGGCGKAGCDDYAKALCEGKATLSQCAPTSNEGKKEIAKILDIEFVEAGATVAVVKCIGGNKCKNKYVYNGYSDCHSQSALYGGKKECHEGCLGSGSCQIVCPTNAIKIVDDVATIDPELCISCGACVTECPKSVVQIIPKDAKVYIGCSNHEFGKTVTAMCENGCMGCGICAKKCPQGAITMVDKLPVIDYSKCVGCLTCANSCPRKSIVIR